MKRLGGVYVKIYVSLLGISDLFHFFYFYLHRVLHQAWTECVGQGPSPGRVSRPRLGSSDPHSRSRSASRFRAFSLPCFPFTPLEHGLLLYLITHNACTFPRDLAPNRTQLPTSSRR
ncbi:hypothetical protein EDB84DRAFT_1420360 [Lactarius hengduanensis]|nr:hypothetical protein EDB84DRAFT_1420360 [Lactarius hengduanensis]